MLAGKEQGNLSNSIYMRVIDCSLVLRAWVICVDLGLSLVYRSLSLGSTGDNLLEAELLKYAGVQRILLSPAMPHLMVVLL